MKVLFVAPDGDLHVGAELARVASGNQVTVLDGLVDSQKLELALHEQYDVIHFAQHGNRGILQMSDGVLGAADLVSMLGWQTSVQLVVVNACNSVAIGIVIHNALHVPVVAHDAPISDGAALTFAEAFYRALRTPRMTVAQAYERALRVLQVQYPDEARTPQLLNGDMASTHELDELRQYIEAGFARFDARLQKVERAVAMLGEGRHVFLQYVMVILLLLLLVAQVMATWMSMR